MAAAAPAPVRPTPRPTYPGFPSPALSAGEQARRKRERKALEQRLLADFNAQAKALYLPDFLRRALANPVGNLRPAPALPAGGRDCFMPASFWKSQNPKNIPGNWSACCTTSIKMIQKWQKYTPSTRVQLFLEGNNYMIKQKAHAFGMRKLVLSQKKKFE